MAAACQCGWMGSSVQVVNGGRCPDCGEKIRYDAAPVELAVGGAIRSEGEFNRRAMIATKGVSFGLMNRAVEIVASCRHRLERSLGLTQRQQKALYNIVHRFRSQVTDQALKDYAATHATGADA